MFACIGVLLLGLLAKLFTLPENVLPIVNQALKEFFLNLPETNPKSYETKTDYKRTLVRLTKEIYTALQEYSKKTNTAMSAAAVYATMKYIEK